MWYASTKSLLESIVRWLKTDTPQDDAEWQTQTDLVRTCLDEILAMSKPDVHPSRLATTRYVHRPAAAKLNRAVPHARSMLRAMRNRDRATALAHGESTLQRLRTGNSRSPQFGLPPRLLIRRFRHFRLWRSNQLANCIRKCLCAKWLLKEQHSRRAEPF